LLRFWFTIFGWSEMSGRLLSIFIGTLAIVSLYFFVKHFAGRKAAFLAILFMVLNNNMLYHSQIIRGYALEPLLVSFTALRFLIFFKDQSFKNMIWYIIPSALIANSNYYGVLFVIVNFILYILLSIWNNGFTWKKSARFLFANIIVAATFLPFFIHTALNRALLDQGFNTWISKPGFTLISFLISLVAGWILYTGLRKKSVPKYFTDKQRLFIDYILGAMCLLFALAFLVSLSRPILLMRCYYPLCLPLAFAAASLVAGRLFYITEKNSVKLACVILMFSLLYTSYHETSGEPDVAKEVLEYINAELSKHRDVNAAVLSDYYIDPESASDMLDFYNTKNIPAYTEDKHFDVLYVIPLHATIDRMYNMLDERGFSRENILKIHVNDQKTVFKKILVNGRVRRGL
jgi:4-amino-4-deoxy-L-arabinose transferase-like glycosyltransferase